MQVKGNNEVKFEQEEIDHLQASGIYADEDDNLSRVQWLFFKLTLI